MTEGTQMSQEENASPITPRSVLKTASCGFGSPAVPGMGPAPRPALHQPHSSPPVPSPALCGVNPCLGGWVFGFCMEARERYGNSGSSRGGWTGETRSVGPEADAARREARATSPLPRSDTAQHSDTAQPDTAQRSAIAPKVWSADLRPQIGRAHV